MPIKGCACPEKRSPSFKRVVLFYKNAALQERRDVFYLKAQPYCIEGLRNEESAALLAQPFLFFPLVIRNPLTPISLWLGRPNYRLGSFEPMRCII